MFGTTSLTVWMICCSVLPSVTLVGDLVEVAHRLAALAVQAADGQVDLVQRLEDLLDLLGQHQRRQVQHHADADAGADVRRAGGEVAELFAEGEADALLELVVDAVDLVPAFVERQPAAEDLDPQVVLLVDHQADGFLRADAHAARAVASRHARG